MRSKGFVKRRNHWIKKSDRSTIYLKPRKSAFSEKVIIELGVFFLTGNLTDEFKNCQLISSVDRITNNESFRWNVEDLTNLAASVEDTFETVILPELEKISNLGYLILHFPNDFDHDKWWLAVIKEADFVKFLARVKA